MASPEFYLEHRDPLVANMYKLQLMAKEHQLPAEVVTQIDKCMDSYMNRDKYCDTVTSKPSHELVDLMTETRDHKWSDVATGMENYQLNVGMLSGSLEGMFMKTLVSMTNAKHVLEVGLFTGCSALSMAEALPADGKVVACEILPYCSDMARRLIDKSSHGKKVTIELAPALDTLNKLAKEGRKFDFIFLDADKSGYIDYYKVIMEHGLLAPRGTIAIDNALFQGVTYSPLDEILPRRVKPGEAILAFNEYVRKDDSVTQVLVPIRDGVMLIRRSEDVIGEL